MIVGATLSRALPAARKAATLRRMNAATETAPAPTPLSKEAAENAREHRLARARRAFREHFARCFWSSDPAMNITEEDIPFVIAGLRKNGGHKEWREAQALHSCR